MPFLTDEERLQLRAQHKRERDGRIRDRIKAVLLRDEGWTWMQISHVLLLSEEVLRKHLKDYQALRKLKPENGGSKEKLSLEQSQNLINHLENYTYQYTKDIVAYIQATFGIEYSVSGLTFWLKRNNFSYKKPSLVPGKANREIQEEWIRKYHQLKENLSKEETICFMDGTHPTHNTHISFGWIRKGRRKELPSNTGRQRLNLSGAIDLIDKKLHYQEDPMLNKEATISFLKRIESSYPTKRKIHLFSDNARYYKNKQVKRYLKNSKIILHFLPAYSPNLNPIERLWKWMKERVLYNTYYEHFDDFKQAIFGFLESLCNLDRNSALAQTFASRVKDHFRAVGASDYTQVLN